MGKAATRKRLPGARSERVQNHLGRSLSLNTKAWVGIGDSKGTTLGVEFERGKERL